MKKNINYLLLILLSIFIIPVCVKANEINSIDMDIYLDNNGTAHVTETWDATLTSGTEGYKPYYNIGEASIENFYVTENNVKYDTLDYWNVNSSFEEKSYKSGINKVDNGIELCWGISDYGNHKYELHYDITGFVAKLNDSDMVYWTLIRPELTSKPKDVKIKIYSDFSYNDTLDVWGYGNKGTAYVSEGSIYLNSKGTLKANQYMTVLVKFPKDTFNTYYKIDKDFDYYFKMAKKGSRKNINVILNKIKAFFVAFIPIVFFIIIFLLPGIFYYLNIKIKEIYLDNRFGGFKYVYNKYKKKLPKDINTVRDIPFTDIYNVYLYSTVYSISNKKTNLLGAIVLKWIKEDKISIVKNESKILKKESLGINLNENVIFENEFEEKLYKMFKSASENNVLESNEFNKYCKKNYSKILNWFDDVLEFETEKMIESGSLIKAGIKRVKITDKFEEDALKVKGVKFFLDEFSRINHKEAIEVKLWDYYLMYAQIFGIADKVAEQFKKLYPDYIENYDEKYDIDLFINVCNISNNWISSANIARGAARRSYSGSNSYSSGGGGFSSSGGGGGSFGGGGPSGSGSGGGFR